MSVQNTAMTGLKAAAIDLQVTGNNIANSGTYGFKQSRTEFADLFYAGSSQLQVGNGVQVSSISQDFSNSGFSVTGGAYDMALANDGFFCLKGASGEGSSYTRTGNFSLDNQGYMVAPGGEKLQGFEAVNGVISSSMNDIQVQFSQVSAPEPTTTVDIAMNFDSSSPVIGAAFDSADSATYNSRTSMSIFDSLGATHIMNTYFAKTADNSWDVHAEVDGTVIGSGTATFTDAGVFSAQAGLSALTFNPGGGAAPNQPIDITLGTATQYGDDTIVHRLNADGFSAGTPGNVNIDQDGVISVIYSNGVVRPVSQVAVAKFDNPQGLYANGKSSWGETNSSGVALITQTNSDSAVKSGSLENSNVDLTDQLVRLITAQRSFQANAQSVKAGDTIAQTIINIA